MDEDSIESPYKDQFDIVRVVLLMETKPFSNKYNQILLTPAQYKLMTNLVWSIMPLGPTGEPRIAIDAASIITLPEDIQSHYE